DDLIADYHADDKTHRGANHEDIAERRISAPKMLFASNHSLLGQRLNVGRQCLPQRGHHFLSIRPRLQETDAQIDHVQRIATCRAVWKETSKIASRHQQVAVRREINAQMKSADKMQLFAVQLAAITRQRLAG